MKKDLGVKPYLFPMPVLMVATYNEDSTVNVLNMAWGGICGSNRVALNLGKGHRTTQNVQKRCAFTVSVADEAHLAEADFFGTVSGNKMPEKFQRSGLHAVKSEYVDAPVIQEFPITLECKVLEIQETETNVHVVGEIVNVLADEKVLDEQGEVDPKRLNALAYDQFQKGYYTIGEKVGKAWSSGTKFMD